MKTVYDLIDVIERAVYEIEDIAIEAARVAKPKNRGSAERLLNILDVISRRVRDNIKRLREPHEKVLAATKHNVCTRIRNLMQDRVQTLNEIDALVENIASDINDIYGITRDIIALMPRFSMFLVRRRLLKRLEEAKKKAENALVDYKFGIHVLDVFATIACIFMRKASRR